MPLFPGRDVVSPGPCDRAPWGNWEWWSFGFSHLVLIYVFAKLWRRAEIVTDVELTELRYGGRPAAVLRGARAFLFAIPINCIAMKSGMCDGRMPANVSVKLRATVTAGLAKLVEAVNQ